MGEPSCGLSGRGMEKTSRMVKRGRFKEEKKLR